MMAAGAPYDIILRPHEQPLLANAPVLRPLRGPKTINVVTIGVSERTRAPVSFSVSRATPRRDLCRSAITSSAIRT